MLPRRRVRYAVLALALLLLGAVARARFAHYFVNERLARYAPSSGYRHDALVSSAPVDSLCVCLAFSGGGYRAAALAYGVLERLRDTEVASSGERKRLLDEVDCISAVSGGSFPAAYYALFGDRLFEEFPARFFERSLHWEIKLKVLRNAWWLWAAHTYKRSDLVAELLDESIFEGKTFGDLAGRGRPFLILNATDMTNGQRFEFTQDQFDLISSDLASFPVSRAVMASSAFPFAFSTITVQNHSRLEGTPPGFALPAGVADAVSAADDDPRLAAWGRHEALYAGAKGPSYLHLTDGGVADNTGVRALWVALRRSDGFLRRRIEEGRTKKLVIIVVNAENDPLRGLGDTESSPNAATVLEKAARIPVNNSTFESIQWIRDDPVLAATLARTKVDMDVIDVSFDRLGDEERRDFLKGLPTGLHLEPANVRAVIAAGREILESSPRFQRLLQELK
jgi:NTE family protein